jgi:ATP/maltotriose-dependent transcriptional regulator MalT
MHQHIATMQRASTIGTPPIPVVESKAIPSQVQPSQTDSRYFHRVEPSLSILQHEEMFLREDLSDLTPREREVVIAICRGGTNEQVADRLCIALPTLRTHLMRLNQKLGTAGKGDVVRHVASVLLTGYRCGQLGPMGPIGSAA